MWMISVGVVALLALVFAFITDGDLSTANQAKDRAEAETEVAKQAMVDESNIRIAISNAVGWTGGAADAKTDLEALADAQQLLRDNFNDLADADKTFEAMVPKVVAEVNKYRQAASAAETAAKTARTEADQARSTLGTVTSDKDSTIQAQKASMADLQASFDETEGNLSQQLSTSNDRVRELEEEVASLKADARRVARDFRGQVKDLEAKNAYLAELTQPLRAPTNLVPDGQILKVSEDLPLAWIDLGADNRLVLGTRFRIEAGNLGERHLKAWAEVIEVQSDMAKVRLYDTVDVFDPIVSGDYIVNPIYDPKGGYNAILVGRFTGLYGRDQLTTLLDQIGIRTQENLDLTTNFMIVGAPILQDQDGYPLEEAIEPSSLPVYQEAKANNVQVIPLSTIQEFFVF
jgi:archaellum component FlaC